MAKKELISDIQKGKPVPKRKEDLKSIVNRMEPNDSVVCSTFNLAQALRAAGEALTFNMRTAREPESKPSKEKEVRGTRKGRYRVWRLP